MADKSECGQTVEINKNTIIILACTFCFIMFMLFVVFIVNQAKTSAVLMPSQEKLYVMIAYDEKITHFRFSNIKIGQFPTWI